MPSPRRDPHWARVGLGFQALSIASFIALVVLADGSLNKGIFVFGALSGTIALVLNLRELRRIAQHDERP